MGDFNNSANHQDDRHKRKKRSFMSIARRQGKQGQYGRGVELKEDEYNYFMKLSQNFKTVQGEEKERLLMSFFSEFTEESCQRYACNQIVSHMMDDLLPLASVSSVLHISTVIGQDLWTICTDPFSSHVLQTVLVIALRLIQEDASQQEYDDEGELTDVAITDEDKQALTQFIMKISRYCCNNLLEFITEKYASHVVRTLFEVLSGVEIVDGSKKAGSKGRALTSHSLRGDGSNKQQQLVVPEQLQEMLTSTANRMMQVPDLAGVISTDCGSAVYQCCLRVLHALPSSLPLCHSLCQHLTTHGVAHVAAPQSCYDNEDNDGGYAAAGGFRGYDGDSHEEIHAVFQSNATARLFEVIIECCSTSQLEIIFQDYFSSKLSSLVQHRIANFTVQRLINSWQDKESFEGMHAAIVAALPTVLAARHTGVLLAWVQACGKLHSHQGQCCTAMMKALDCHEPEERQQSIAPAVVFLANHDTYTATAAPLLKVTLHGALMLQEFLKFRKPIKFINSLLAMPTPALVTLLQDPRGSHITDAFCNSSHVGEKSRNKLVCKLQDDAVSFACSKHGSRSLEVLWGAATSVSRSAMCQRLADSARQVKGNEYGAILYSKLNVRLFSRADKADWADMEQKKATKRKMLASFREQLVEQDSEPLPKKKKKSKSKLAADLAESSSD